MTRASVFLIVAALLLGLTGCDPSLGPGPAPAPAPGYVQIRTWHDMHAVRGDLGGHYVLVNDLDSSSPGYRDLASSTASQGKGWQPIGTSDGGFSGTFDGQGYEIRDLFIKRPDEGFVGLFGAVDQGGVVQSLRVANAAVTGEWAVGILAGSNRGNIRDSSSAGSVTGDDCVGGLVGGSAGAVSGCRSTATVNGVWDVGGLLGCNDPGGAVSKSYSAGSVTGEWSVGGLVGGNLGGTVRECYSVATAIGDDYVGGLVGDNQGIVSNCYATSGVIGQWYVGGLVGYNDSGGRVSNSYASGTVSGEWHAGGLVGGNDEGTVSSSFWDADTSGREDSDGGTAKTTAAMRDIATFTNTATQGLNQAWDIVAVAPGGTNTGYIWNIVDGQTYPFLSWQSA
jgi:hypothetical protein